MEPIEDSMEPIEDNNTDTIQCQLYNDWTRPGFGRGDNCRFIIQSPTGIAYVITYPMFERYRDQLDMDRDVYNRFYKMLEYHLITRNYQNIDTWIASVSYEDMCLIRDYGKPIDMPKQDWMYTYDGLREEIDQHVQQKRKKLPIPTKSSDVGAWLDQMLDNQIEEDWWDWDEDTHHI